MYMYVVEPHIRKMHFFAAKDVSAQVRKRSYICATQFYVERGTNTETINGHRIPAKKGKDNCREGIRRASQAENLGLRVAVSFVKHSFLCRRNYYCDQNHFIVLTAVRVNSLDMLVKWIVPQFFKLLPKRHIFFDLVIRFITNRKYAFFCIF